MESSVAGSLIEWKDVSRDIKYHKHNKYQNIGCIKNLVEYIMKDKITQKRVRFCGGTGVDYIFFQKAYKQMKSVKKYFKKLSGRQVWHYVLSFPFSPSNENILIAYEIGLEIINTCFKNYQSIFAVHENTDNLHIHFLINSVSYIDGRKWHLTIWESRHLKDYIENISKEYFLSAELLPEC